MLVLIQVSSMKTRRWGSKLACHDRQRRRRRATSARAYSRANSVFFESQSFAPQERPDRIMRDLNPARSEFVLQLVKCQMRRLADPLFDESAMWFQHRLAVSAHLARGHRAGRPIALRPLHHRGHRNTKPRRHHTAAFASCHRRHHSLSKIIGKRSAHLMLAPAQPAS